MESDSEEYEFPGFETEAERARLLRNQISSDESDISGVSSDSESSESDREEEIVDVRSTDDSPVRVRDFTQSTGATSRIPEDGTALDFFQLLFPESLFETLSCHLCHRSFFGNTCFNEHLQGTKTTCSLCQRKKK